MFSDIRIALAFVLFRKWLYLLFAKNEIDPFSAFSILERLLIITLSSPTTVPLSFLEISKAVNFILQNYAIIKNYNVLDNINKT